MSVPADRSDTGVIAPTWQVVVDMPVFPDGKDAGKPVGWLSLNNLPKSLRDQIRKNKAAKLWRVAAYNALVKARVPQHLGRISVTIELRFTTRQTRRNAANYELTIKPVIDALGPLNVYHRRKNTGRGAKNTVVKTATDPTEMVVELGRDVVPDDDTRYLIRPGEPLIGEPLGRGSRVTGQVILTIRQIPPEQ
jgi:hypothetical protein